MRGVVVFGGYGVFGSLVCRELAGRGTPVTVAGRDRNRAQRMAETLGHEHRGLAADVRDAASLRAALAGHRVAIHCAGPFRQVDRALLDACADSGCHYVDIADDRAYAAMVRAQAARFRERGLTAAFGCSSVPGLSGALAAAARASREEPPSRVRVTLFIGNDNVKSAAAVGSVVGGLGLDIRAPQGPLRAFRDRDRVVLPPPFGPRTAYAFDGPDYDLLPERLGVRDVRVLVGFENRAAGPAFALLAALGWRGGARAASVLAAAGGLVRSGSSGGSVIADVFWADGGMRREGLHAEQAGQRLAAVPAAAVAHALATDESRPRGALSAGDVLGVDGLLSAVEQTGFRRIQA